jgi:hypothetical protein
VKKNKRPSAVRRCHGVPAPVRRDEVESPVAVQVARRDPIPSTRPPAETPRLGRGTQTAAPVEEQQDGPPLASENQVRIPIAVDVGEECRRDQADAVEDPDVARVDGESASVVPDERGGRAPRILPGNCPAADEQIQVSIAIVIAERHRACGGPARRDERIGARGETAAGRGQNHGAGH